MGTREATVNGILDYDDLVPEKFDEFFNLLKKAGYDKDEYCEYCNGVMSQFYFEEDTLKITGFCTPGDPGCRYLPNGDPGNPPEPDEVEDIKVMINGHDVTDCLIDEYPERYAIMLREKASEEMDDERGYNEEIR